MLKIRRGTAEDFDEALSPRVLRTRPAQKIYVGQAGDPPLQLGTCDCGSHFDIESDEELLFSKLTSVYQLDYPLDEITKEGRLAMSQNRSKYEEVHIRFIRVPLPYAASFFHSIKTFRCAKAIFTVSSSPGSSPSPCISSSKSGPSFVGRHIRISRVYAGRVMYAPGLIVNPTMSLTISKSICGKACPFFSRW